MTKACAPAAPDGQRRKSIYFVIRASAFVIPSSFVLRHSSFSTVHRVFPYLLLLAAAFLVVTLVLGFLVEPNEPGAGIYWFKMRFFLAVSTGLGVMVVCALALR